MSTPGPFIPRLLPADPATATAQDELDATGLPAPVAPREPVFTGRAPIFDFATERFARGAGSAPLMHRGMDALQGWIEKCLMTERDASPVHPPGYGVEGRTEFFGQPIEELDVVLLEERVADALTFHPRITAVVDLTVTADADGEYADLEFLVVTDVGDRLPIALPLGAPDA